MSCPLCQSQKSYHLFEEGKRDYFQCLECSLIYLHPDQRISIASEKARYGKHRNFIEDEGYLNFLDPLRQIICASFSKGTRGLDYGCGKNPVLSHLLQSEGFDIEPYDPLFFPSSDKSEASYDFVFSCEAFEHFHDVKKELQTINKLLKSGGELLVQTQFFEQAEKLRKSRYIRDETHVCFFGESTFRWVAGHFQWDVAFPKENIAVLYV